MDKQIIIHGEQVPVITLTRHQIEEDWYSLHSQLQDRKTECEELKNKVSYYEKEREESHKANIHNLVLLKRKERECEHRKSELIEANNQVIYLTKQLEEKEQECEELKELVANSKFAEFVLDRCKLNFPIIQKYENAFKDIKKLIKKYKDEHRWALWFIRYADRILQIIDGVEGETE